MFSPPTEGCPFAFAKRSEQKRSAGKGGVVPSQEGISDFDATNLYAC